MDLGARKDDGLPGKYAGEKDGDCHIEDATHIGIHVSPMNVSKVEEGVVAAQDSRNHKLGKETRSQKGWRHVVRNLTPSWFAVNMGTGITSILLHNLPYNGDWLRYISYIIFALNVMLFIIFLMISTLRYTLYPSLWKAMMRQPAESLFLGCFPMGLATIINMVCIVCVPQWRGHWWQLAWALWWIDVIIASAMCCYLPFLLYVLSLEPLHGE